jgi:hypothetical protein
MERKRNPGIRTRFALRSMRATLKESRESPVSRDVLIVIVASWVRHLPALHFIPIINN